MTRFFAPFLVIASALGCDGIETVPVTCTVDGDCPLAGDVCDPQRKVCICGPGVCIDAAAGGGAGGGGQGGSDASVAGQGGYDAATVDASGSCGRDDDCPAATPVCSGNRCVQCATDAQCSSNSAKSFCRNNACVGCDGAGGAQACAARSSAAPVCSTSSGSCVECLAAASSDCTDPLKPICNTITNRCEKCASDGQCAAKAGAQNPGICLDHQGGRCATDAETLYVQKTSACSDSPVGATACTVTSPCCGLQAAISKMNGVRTIIAVSGPTAVLGFDQPTLGAPTSAITIIGRGSKPPVTAPGVHLDGGTLFLRNLEIATGAAIGISASNAAITARDLLVDNNKGGVLLDRCTFDLQKVVVTANSAAFEGSTAWGGILVQNAMQSPRKLTNVSVTDNKGPGVSCTGLVDGSGVYATNNSTADISPTCGITNCAAPMPGVCGAD